MRKLFLLAMGVVWAASVFAATETTMPEVVVTGKAGKSSSVSPGVEKAKKEIGNIPGGVAVITKESYATGRASTPQDILGWVPGVHVQQRDTASLESRISIRGSGLQRTFHLRGINLLQDGIPLNQADGGGDAQRIEPLAVDYVEVYRGGNALRYGSTTLGGAVNFVSPTGYTADPLQARVEFGDFGYIRSQVSSGRVLGPADYYVSVSQFKQDGYRDHTDQDNYDIFANAGYKFTDTVESRLYFTFIEAKSKLGGSLTKAQLNTDPEQANAMSVSQNRKRDFEYMRVASKTTLTRDAQKLDVTGWWSSYDLFHPISPVIYQDDDDWGAETRYTNDGELFGRKNELVAGLSGSIGYQDDDRYNNVGGLPAGIAGRFDNVASNANLYAEDTHYLTDRFALVGGGQLVWAERDVQDYYFVNGDDSGRVIYRSFDPKAGAFYDVNETVRVFGNYNRSFEPPSFSEMTTPAGDFLPNKGQLSDTVEFGTRGTRERFGWDVTYYHSWLDNELLSLVDSTGTALGTINAPSQTIHQGVELGANADLWRGIWSQKEGALDKFTFRAVYDWNDFRFDGDPLFGSNRLPGFPEHFFKAELLYEHPSGIYLGPNMEQTFDGYPIDMANTFYADPYVIWGFKAGYRQAKGPSFFVEGKNLFDETYAATTGVVTNALGRDTNATFNPGLGRSWFAGVEFRW